MVEGFIPWNLWNLDLVANGWKNCWCDVKQCAAKQPTVQEWGKKHVLTGWYDSKCNYFLNPALSKARLHEFWVNIFFYFSKFSLQYLEPALYFLILFISINNIEFFRKNFKKNNKKAMVTYKSYMTNILCQCCIIPTEISLYITVYSENLLIKSWYIIKKVVFTPVDVKNGILCHFIDNCRKWFCPWLVKIPITIPDIIMWYQVSIGEKK